MWENMKINRQGKDISIKFHKTMAILTLAYSSEVWVLLQKQKPKKYSY